jgi:3-methyladenine DNA glycosylase AlkD
VGLRDVKTDIREHASKKHAEIAQWFFKTGPGEYGEGDVFLGVRAAQMRAVARTHRELKLSAVEKLLRSKYHEDRSVALLILVDRFAREETDIQKEIYELYLANTRYINGWDLVDVSAPGIVGAWLYDRSRRPLRRLAKSRDLWERRIAILATFWFIRRDEFDDTLDIASMLLKDEHDLIHKAVGWMLRELGKRDRAAEEAFLKKHYKTMPRTMLRYAIERFPEGKRKKYLKGSI